MKNKDGFTLLEILVAVIIFTIGLTSLLPLFTAGATSQKRGADQTTLSVIAERVVAEIQTNLTTTTPGGIRNARIPDYPNYQYDVAFQQVQNGDAFVADITIKWLAKGVTRTEEFSTLLLRNLKHQNP